MKYLYLPFTRILYSLEVVLRFFVWAVVNCVLAVVSLSSVAVAIVIWFPYWIYTGKNSFKTVVYFADIDVIDERIAHTRWINIED
jgi:hypothetical protein